MMKFNVTKRTISLLITAAMILCILPFGLSFSSADTAAGEPIIERVSDPSTMDGWKSLFTEDSTVNAGGVWADKSVFTDTSAFSDEITMGDDNLLVALSAISSNKEIVGYATIPTDTMLVLDVSGSMRNSGWDDDLAVAANAAIRELLKANLNNRVGVVLYSGNYETGTSTYEQGTTLLLPLERYTTANDNVYLSHSNGTISVDRDVRTEDGGNPADLSRSVTGGTYIQAGINEAMNQFLKADTTVNDGFQDGKKRLPIFVLMSDGDPTVATTNYDDVDKTYTVGQGNNRYTTDRSNVSNGARSSDSVAFLTQLTASYALSKAEEHYGCEGEGLFYTLSLGSGVSNIGKSVLNPSESTTNINGLWNDYFKLSDNTAMTFSVPGTGNSGTKSVSIYKNSAVTTQNYVDKYFPAEDEDDFINVFKSIVDEIILQSRYYPTNLEGGNPDFSGYVTFTDTIGEYMEVKNVTGIIWNEVLHTGKRLSDSITPDVLGSIENPTEFGYEFIDSVQTRLNISDKTDAFALIRDAYLSGQLIYTEDDPNCYIGWYADANENYLGFWNEGVTTAPENAVFKIKSYGFLGDEVGNLRESDMMYMTLRVVIDIETGKQTVVWQIPAALVPLITYSVSLEGDKIEGAQNVQIEYNSATPARLLFEVGLRSDINPYNVSEITASKHIADDGVTRRFWTNHFDISAPDHEHHVTTSVTFTPSTENELYYFTTDAIIYEYINGQYVPVTDDNHNFDSNKTYYHANYMFNTDSSVPLNNYTKIYAEPLSKRVYDTDKDAWIIPLGTAIIGGDSYAVPKTENASDSAGFSLYPYVVKTNSSYDAYFNVGNNGLLTLKPAQGIRLAKSVDATQPGSNTDFSFTVALTAPAGTVLATEYPVLIAEAGTTDGTTQSIAVNNGVMTIPLSAGQTAYITGLPTGTKYIVEEALHSDYVLKSVHLNGVDVTDDPVAGTIKEYTLDYADFVNTIAAEGSLMISKTVTHPFGSGYIVPDDIKFTAKVTLSNDKVDVIGESYELILNDGSVSSVTTDANGSFTVTLGNNETAVIHGLPEGTTNYSVTEINLPDGFTLDTNASSGLNGTIMSASAQQARLVNAYIPDGVTAELDIVVEKLLEGRKWLENESYSFTVYRYDPYARAVTLPIGEITVNASDADKKASIELNEAYTTAGTYQYIIRETVGNAGGVTYDSADRRFRVFVEDTDMDGELEISKVENMMNTVVTKNGSAYTVSASFTNSYTAFKGASITLPVKKTMTGNFGLNGFTFGLFEGDGEEPLVTSSLTDINGNASFNLYFPASMVGKSYTYILREMDSGISGMEENTQEYEITFTVTDNLDGTVSVTADIDGEVLTDNNAPQFNNVYDPVDAQMLFSGSKQLTGRVQSADEFSFNLYQAANDEFVIDGVTPIETVTNSHNGGFIFKPVQFDTAGVYYFVITEEKGALGGVAYDEKVYNITVTVTDNNGTLVATSDLAENVIFNNVYTPAPVEITLEGQKTLRGRDIVDGEFSFTLTDEKGVEVETATNQGDAFKFTAITYNAAGTYKYTLTEVAGSLAGITYDSSVYEITVTVTDNGNGKLLSEIAVTKDGRDATGIVFVNEYLPQPYTLSLEGVKVLQGRELRQGEFEFQLVNVLSGEVIETVSNDAEGNFKFSDIILHEVGTHHYHVSEIGEEVHGVTYDTTVYHVDVEVSDVGGRLDAVITVNDTADTDITFTNLYDPIDATVDLKGSKTFTNGELSDGLFQFNLIENGDVIETVSNNAEGEFSFSTLTFNKVGVYEYTIQEVNGGSKGVIYDTAEHKVVITVTDANGMLVAEVSIDGENTDIANIINLYDPDDAKVTLNGTKIYNGAKLAGDDFSFELVSENQVIETVKNGKDGRFSFTELSFDKAGVYEYIIREVNDGKEGVTYDTADRKVKITVTDNAGVLEAVCVIDGKTTESVSFTNTFVPNPDDINLDVNIEKTVNNIGYEDIGPEGFKFLLKNSTDGSEMTVTSDENGKGSFTLTFTKDDVGKTFNYTLAELDEGMEGVTYDTTVYSIDITVGMDEEYNLYTTCEIDGDEATAILLKFENTYEPYIPDTGDESNNLAWVLMLIASIVVLAKLAPTLNKRIGRF